MNNILYITIGIPGILYLGQALQYSITQHRYGMTLVMIGYAIACVGLILDSKGW